MQEIRKAIEESIKESKEIVPKILARKKGEEEAGIYAGFNGKGFNKNINEYYVDKKPLAGYLALKYLLGNELEYSTFFVYNPDLQGYRDKALAQAARCMYHCVVLGESLSYMYPTPRFIDWGDANQYLAVVMLVGWEDKAKEMALLYEKSMQTYASDTTTQPDGIVDGGRDDYSGAWFIFELARKYWSLTIDPEKVHYPENFGPYQAVLAQWDTHNVTQVEQWVSVLCDRHMEQAVDYESDQNGEFVGQNTEMFPYEILFWLRLRSCLGLPNPARYSHPFMSVPEATVPLVDWPDMPILDKLFEQMSADYPQQLGETLSQQRIPPATVVR